MSTPYSSDITTRPYSQTTRQNDSVSSLAPVLLRLTKLPCDPLGAAIETPGTEGLADISRQVSCTLNNGTKVMSLAVLDRMVRYPKIQVAVNSRNPLAIVAAVREQMRLAGIDPHLIQRFSDEALSQEDSRLIHHVCREWVEVHPPGDV
jgi:hypothetical protein